MDNEALTPGIYKDDRHPKPFLWILNEHSEESAEIPYAVCFGGYDAPFKLYSYLTKRQFIYANKAHLFTKIV